MKKPEKIHDQTSCMAALNAMSDSFYVIGGKWKLRIIISLKNGNKRFNEIQRSIPGLSAKVLSGELKDLEANGLIQRVVHNETPVVVEYLPTSYSDTLEPVLNSLVAWGENHREKIRNGEF